MRSLTRTLALSLGVWPSLVTGQVDYRSGESGRPLRVTDAAPVETGALVLQLAPLRLERLSAGVERWQAEPRLSWGVLPRTEVELRAPIVYREATASPRGGLAGIGIGASRQFNDERPAWPSLAVGGEVVLPAGGASSNSSTWVLRAMMTRTMGAIRLHVNGAVGSYNSTTMVPDPSGAPPAGCVVNCFTALPPIIDFPCAIESVPGASANACSAAATASAVLPAAADARVPLRRSGRRVLLGLAADHSFALASTLVAADVFVERFSTSSFPADWTAEIGVRHQLTPRMTLDAGLGRRFTGNTPAWIVTAGASHAWVRPLPLAHRGRP